MTRQVFFFRRKDCFFQLFGRLTFIGPFGNRSSVTSGPRVVSTIFVGLGIGLFFGRVRGVNCRL